MNDGMIRLAVEQVIHDWIHGPFGMDAYEEHEWVIWNVSEREAAARWAVRCLANPSNGGSRDVLLAILRRRGDADALLLVWDGHSAGSADMRDRARRHGLPMLEIVVRSASKMPPSKRSES